MIWTGICNYSIESCNILQSASNLKKIKKDFNATQLNYFDLFL